MKRFGSVIGWAAIWMSCSSIFGGQQSSSLAERAPIKNTSLVDSEALRKKLEDLKKQQCLPKDNLQISSSFVGDCDCPGAFWESAVFFQNASSQTSEEDMIAAFNRSEKTEFIDEKPFPKLVFDVLECINEEEEILEMEEDVS